MKKIIPILLFLASQSVFGQFNTRFVLDVSAGAASPVHFGSKLDPDRNIYILPNFGMGYQTNFSIFYNLSLKTSLGISLQYDMFNNWKDPVESSTKYHEEFSFDEFTPEFHLASWAVVLRHRVFADAKISPFFGLGLTYAQYVAEVPPRIEVIVQDDAIPTVNPNEHILDVTTVARTGAVVVDLSSAIGYQAYAGVDWRVSNYLTAYLQTNYEEVLTANNKKLRLNTRIAGLSLGLRLNIFKRKSIL